MSIDGKNVVRVTNSPYTDLHPRFSPDDSKVVFASYRDSDYSEIYLINIDGSDVVRLTKNQGNNYYPRFSSE